MCVTVAVPSALGLITTFGCSEEKPATEPADSAVDATAGDATSSDSSALDTNASDTIVADTSDDTCTCTTPPAATCADSVTRRTYALPGTCGDGGCSYASTDSPCPNGTLCKAGVCESPPSCSGGLTCISGDSCCSTLYVPGGSFNRSYDAVTPEYSDPKWKATISPFRLDKYEVTVGRFRKFVDAWAAGYRPAVGSGVHTHLRGGLGLVGESYTSWAGSVTDGGWIASYATKIPTSKAAFDTALNCDTIYGGVTWTPSAGTNETLPINCINWYEALAFCIWDGGFLPSEAEWNFAAAGGSEHRRYPWGSTAPTNLHACLLYTSRCV